MPPTPLPCLHSPDAFVRADPPELAAAVLTLGWVLPGRSLDSIASVQPMLGEQLVAWGILPPMDPKKRFTEMYTNDTKYAWAFEPLVEGLLHLQTRYLCISTTPGESSERITRQVFNIYLLRRGRQAIQSGDLMKWLR